MIQRQLDFAETMDGVCHEPASNVGGGRIAELFDALYSDLCRLARREVRRNGASDLLSTSTLVHEAWLDIRRSPSLAFDSTGEFLAYAGRMMRGLAIDRVRTRHSQRRGGGLVITSLDTLNSEEIDQPELLANLAEALEELAALDPDLANVVDLKFFGGFTLSEIATMQFVSERTVQRRWNKARMLLFRSLR